MKLPVVWLAEAEVELQEAAAWYEAISPRLAVRFVYAIDEAVKAIATAPLQYAVVSHGRRRAGVRRFPYGLFFLVEEQRIVVLACFHAKRNPRRWQKRG